MWEISEGDTKLRYTMKLVPPKDPGSIVHPNTIHFKVLFIATLFIASTGTIHHGTIH